MLACLIENRQPEQIKFRHWWGRTIDDLLNLAIVEPQGRRVAEISKPTEGELPLVTIDRGTLLHLREPVGARNWEEGMNAKLGSNGLQELQKPASTWHGREAKDRELPRKPFHLSSSNLLKHSVPLDVWTLFKEVNGLHRNGNLWWQEVPLRILKQIRPPVHDVINRLCEFHRECKCLKVEGTQESERRCFGTPIHPGVPKGQLLNANFQIS